MDFGKYAWFIWPSYVVFALLIGGLVAATLRSSFAARKTLEKLTDSDGKPKP